MIDEGIYRHYKGNLYRVLCVAKHTETMEEMVVYQDAIDEEKYWTRPAAMWNEMVTVNGRKVPRFQYLGQSLEQLDRKRVFRVIEAIKDNMEAYDSTSEDNELGFLHKPTGEIVHIPQALLSALEDGEATDDYDATRVKQAEDAFAHWDDYIRLPDDDVDEYGQMERFICELPLRYQEELERAIRGKGAFRRFKAVAARLGVAEEWYLYLAAAYRKEARAWCECQGIEWWKDLL